jgi:hypothetical protein|tara:strand:- start:11721 stop:12269 length:549 start_codon:yes stop_codon:yes gene_type:complete
MKIICVFVIAFASTKGFPKDPPVPMSDREKILAVAVSQIGIKEATGRNDGEVEKYIDSVGLDGKAGYPYCVAAIYWTGKEALGSKNPYPKSAWSPDFVKKGERFSKTTVIKGGECGGIYFRSKGRIAHGFICESFDGKNLITIEWNTNAKAAVGSAGDRDGQNVCRKRRHYRTVHSVRDWLK